VPGVDQRLAAQIVAFVQELRDMDLFKLPGIAETIDWTQALIQLDALALDPEMINNTLGALLKYQDDIAKVTGSEAATLLSKIDADIAAREAV
jgi:MoxR-like ATPase